MEIKELRLKSEGELDSVLHDLRKKREDLEFKSKQNQLKEVRNLRVVKKDIAQVLTVLKEKK
ncbi:MAG: 50S ribosomal protein L29 [Patescibacteria group bacterium]|jgi:large subunit ribosomal protein L29